MASDEKSDFLDEGYVIIDGEKKHVTKLTGGERMRLPPDHDEAPGTYFETMKEQRVFDKAREKMLEQNPDQDTWPDDWFDFQIDQNPRVEPELEMMANRPFIEYKQGHMYLAVAGSLYPLAKTQEVFQRAQRLVRIVQSKKEWLSETIARETDTPIIFPMSKPHLAEVMSRTIEWLKYSGRSKRLVEVEPPNPVVSAVHSRGYWSHIPTLRGVSTVPILRKDGTLCVKQGYDEETEFYYVPNCPEPVIPGSPKQYDAEYGCQKLLEVIQDFPFEHGFHKSVWLSLVLSRVAKPAFEGNVPMTLIDANTPGTGKSLLADSASVLSTGLLAARSPYVREDDEMRKRVSAHLVAGDQFILIDNVPGGQDVGWPALDAALTAEVWSDRELGKTNIIRLPMESIWVVTGNNLAVKGDAGRRTLKIRILATVERPEERTGFSWYPLLQCIRQDRPFLIGHAINIIKAYIQAGTPDMGLTPIGSYEGWSDTIRSAIVWAGQPDPAQALCARDTDIDEEALAHSAIMGHWGLFEDLSSDGQGLTTAQILGQLDRRAGDLEDLRDAFLAVCPTRDGKLPTARRLGKSLRRLSDRIRMANEAPMVIKRSHDRAQGVCKWKAVKVD